MSKKQIPSKIKLLHPPKYQAYLDWREGLMLSDNPFPIDSPEYSVYEREMGQLFSNELKGIYQEIDAGV